MANNNISQERISQKLSSGTDAKSRKGIIIAVSCIFVLIIVVVVGVLVFAAPNNATKTRNEIRNTVVTPENVDEIIANMKEHTPAGQYEVMMNTSWEFETGDSASSNAYVENSTANTNDVYFDIVRSDTKETIFKSPTIPIGSRLEGITLDTALEAGSYSCVLTYHLLDDQGEPVSKLNINLDITVNH